MTIYLSRRNGLDPALAEAVSQLEGATEVEITEKHVPAVAGELAGDAIQILLSDPVEAFTTAVEIGALIWGVIKAMRVAGKHLSLGKKEVKALAAAEAKEVHDEAQPQGEPVIWGPMTAQPESGKTAECMSEHSQRMLLTAIVFPIARARARTYWYLISDEGDVCATWSTQTLRDRLPDFLKP